jgi:hypothetical protein
MYAWCEHDSGLWASSASVAVSQVECGHRIAANGAAMRPESPYRQKSSGRPALGRPKTKISFAQCVHTQDRSRPTPRGLRWVSPLWASSRGSSQQPRLAARAGPFSRGPGRAVAPRPAVPFPAAPRSSRAPLVLLHRTIGPPGTRPELARNSPSSRVSYPSHRDGHRTQLLRTPRH